jgi:hypothetical protein
MASDTPDFDEDQFRELTTWLGKAPQLTDRDMPVDFSPRSAPADFAANFNSSPLHATNDLRARFPELSDVFNLGPFLFHCRGLWPRAMSCFVFDPRCPDRPGSILHYFFRAVNIEFISLPEAARILLSHIALPDDGEHLCAVIRSFADAYLASNGYVNMPIEAICSMTRATIVHAIHKRADDSLPVATFLKPWLSGITAPGDFKRRLYDACERNPIPIFFTFASSVEVPNLHRAGFMYKVGSSITRKKKRWFAIEGFRLRYYNDPKMTQPMGEADLAETVTEIVKPTAKKDTDHIVLRKRDGSTFGTKFAKGGKKKNHRADFTLYGKDTQTLQAWAASCNIVAFVCELLKQQGRVPS